MAKTSVKNKPSKPKNDPDEFFRRMLHRAWMRGPEGIIYTGESLALAMLVQAKGKSRNKKELEQIQKMMDDPNLGK